MHLLASIACIRESRRPCRERWHRDSKLERRCGGYVAAARLSAAGSRGESARRASATFVAVGSSGG